MLKILTFNINGPGTKFGPWQRRKELVCRVIEASGTDICALQAVLPALAETEEPDQARQLAAMLPEYSYVCSETAPGTADGMRLASAFLSRIPLAEVRAVPLSRRSGTEDPFDRILLYGRFELADGPLHVFNAHFSWVAAQALDNVREALAAMSTARGRRLLLGDMNQTPESAPMERLQRAGWCDVWARLRGGESGMTFESAQPRQRIDYAWMPEELLGQVQAIELAATQAEGDLRPSDHLGLMVTLAG